MVVDGDLIATRDRRRHHGDDRDAVAAIDRLRVMGEDRSGRRATMVGEGDRKALAAGGSHGSSSAWPATARPSRLPDSILDDLAGATAWRVLRICDDRPPGGAPFLRRRLRRRWSRLLRGDYADALRQFGDAEGAAALAAMPSIRRQLLFCPGPVLVSRHVKRALAAPEIGHRATEFSELLNRTRLKLGRVFGVRNFHRYTTVILTGSGSAANEALLGTAAVGRRLLVLTNGEFGERLPAIARHLGIDTSVLASRWGQPLDLAGLERAGPRSVEAVAWVHHETTRHAQSHRACGLARPTPTVRGRGVSLGGCRRGRAHASRLTGKRQQGDRRVPGLAFVCGRATRRGLAPSGRARSTSILQASTTRPPYQTPNTPAVISLRARAALDDCSPGARAPRRPIRGAARRLRRGFRRLGLRPFIPTELMSPLLTTVELPVGFSADEFHDRIKREGYIVYAGKGILHDRVFQVANIGALKRGHVDAFLDVLRRIMEVSRDHSSGDPGRRRRLAAAAAH